VTPRPPAPWLLAALTLIACGCGGPRDRFRGLPTEQVQFVFGPWLNGMLLPPEERHQPHVALVELLETGEVFVRLPRDARGPAWCHVTAPGYEPILLWGDVQDVGRQLRGGRLRFRPIGRPDLGIVTGVTWHGAPAGLHDVHRACRDFEPSTTMAFVDEAGRKTLVRANDRGVYRADLPPGLYKVAASWLTAGAGKAERVFAPLDVAAGHTAVLDICLTRLAE